MKIIMIKKPINYQWVFAALRAPVFLGFIQNGALRPPTLPALMILSSSHVTDSISI
jgi:hypothetical protein